MLKLFIFNIIVICFIILILIILKKKIKTEKGFSILIIILPTLTILCHYSSILVHFIKDHSGLQHIVNNPSLILPIYPCNVCMWCLLILGLAYRKNNRFVRFLIDYCFYVGVVCAVVGMFANIDFIRDPSFANFDVLKATLSHCFLLLNILALPTFKKVKIDLPVNIINIVISIIMLFVLGCYCNLVVSVFGGTDYANTVNSMFILHTPFENIKFLTFGPISIATIILYFGVFSLLELIKYPKENRWYKRKFNW